ncbi:hypothetical protein [Fructobacillus americanaquae]|uniref:Tellurite resistance protein n=1 Tax=Fructobacillus americanaquae TaxID=2940302 RepID=A0ABY5C288_9LACO|nr:hypothetical protein [Fructobacillus americanaquae]USS92288.1 hypothetical protein M3M36_01340 [Fructobacillus americanaquae]
MAALKAARKAAVLMLSAVENQGQLHTALQAGLGALGQVAEPTLKLAYQPVSAADKIDIEKMLIQYGRAKQERFAKNAQVDPDSLEQQQQQIDHILDQVNKNLAQVKVNQELTTVQKQVLAKIDLVADPVLLSAYQLVTDRERAVAEQKITAVSQSKRADFWAIEHVDQQSLKQQLEQLADVLRTGQSLMQQAKVRYQFDAAVKQSLADMQSVAQPSIASEYRLARANQKVDAKQTLLLAAKEKVDYFAKLDGVDQSSLMIQKELLADIVQRYSALVDQVKTVHDLHVLLNKAVQDVNHIKHPQQNWQDQAVNKDEIQTASQDVTATGENRMQDFGQIIGVDPTALSQQQQVVSRAVQDGLVAINLAKLIAN